MPRERECCFLSNLSSITGVRACVFEGFAWVWDESRTSVSKLEQPLQVWPVRHARLLMFLQLFVFPLVVGLRTRKDGFEKERLFKKTVGRTQTRERQLTVWSPAMSGQVLAGWLLHTASWKTICWDDSIKGNHSARKPLVIAQPAFRADECKTGTRERE